MKNPFRKVVRIMGSVALLLAICGPIVYGFVLLRQRHDRIERKERNHQWADTTDKAAAIVASDGLVAVFGQATASRIAPVGRAARVTVAGGRREWRFLYKVPSGPYSDAQQACVFVWRQSDENETWSNQHIVVKNCRP